MAKNLSLEEETKENGRLVILVSKDVLVRVKADAIGLLAEDFLNDRVVDHDEIYSGYKDIFFNSERSSAFKRNFLVQPSFLPEPVYQLRYVPRISPDLVHIPLF